MRAHEFLREDNHEQDIKNELMTLLTTLHASQVPSVSLAQVKKSLEADGFFVTNRWITDTVDDIKVVKNVDNDQIFLDVDTDTGDTESGTAPDQTQSKEKVKKMAKQALKGRLP